MLDKTSNVDHARHAPKAAQSRMETLIITPAMVNEWRLPSFQRPFRMNDKVHAVSEKIKQTEVVEGIITLGKIRNSETLYVVDGQHRLEAFKISMLPEAIADIRIVIFDTMTEMAEEFNNLNTSLVKMRPDDNLRALEHSVPALETIRKHCEFVGYDNIRRGAGSAIISMATVVRCWSGAQGEMPSHASNGRSAAGMAQDLEPLSVQNLCAFLNIAVAAWGRDPEYYRLWARLNLTMSMWFWNRLVIDRDRSGSRRYDVLNAQQFKQCLMALTADTDYVEWLTNRQLSDRERSPCHSRMKMIFTKRLTATTNRKPLLPSPSWSSK